MGKAVGPMKAENIRRWDDEVLLREMRHQTRPYFPESYPPIFAEALARILERLAALEKA